MTVSDDDISELINEELLARRVKAMFLKNAGATLAKIAEECHVSVATVRKDLAIVRRDINNEPPIDVIARHRAVIFDIQRANYPAMMRGNKDAAMTILRALEREARLLGLDQPVKLLAAVSNEEFANEAARLIERINELDPATLKELERARGHDPFIIEGETTDVDPEPVGGQRVPEGQGEGVVGRVRQVVDAPDQPAEPDGRHDGGSPVLGPWRPGQPVADSAVTDGAGDAGGLPGDAGSADDDDDGWSNI